MQHNPLTRSCIWVTQNKAPLTRWCQTYPTIGGITYGPQFAKSLEAWVAWWRGEYAKGERQSLLARAYIERAVGRVRSEVEKFENTITEQSKG